MSNVRPMIHDMIRPMITSITDAVCRQIATFDGVDQYITLPTVTPPGDFEIELELKTTNAASQMTVIGGNSTTDYIRIDISSNVVRFFSEVGGFLQPVVSVAGGADGNLNTVVVKYTGTTPSVSLNGGTPSTGTWALDGLQIIDVIGATTPIPRDFFDGNIRNVKIWTGGDRITGTLVRSFNIDDGFGNDPVILDSATANNGTAINFDAATWSQECT